MARIARRAAPCRAVDHPPSPSFGPLSLPALSIARVYPCKSLVAGPDNVEMDPESEMDVRNRIMDSDLQIVGWYHSHPYFQPDPSVVDVHNQANYQQLFQDEAVRDEPFVGLIVGTYDPRLPTDQSVITAFHLPRSDGALNEPRNVRVHVEPLLATADSLAALQEQLVRPQLATLRRQRAHVDCSSPANPHVVTQVDVVKACALAPNRIDLNERWRQDRDDTKLHKLLGSLRSRLVAWRGAAAPAEVNCAPADAAAVAAAAPGDAPEAVSALLTAVEAAIRSAWAA